MHLIELFRHLNHVVWRKLLVLLWHSLNIISILVNLYNLSKILLISPTWTFIWFFLLNLKAFIGPFKRLKYCFTIHSFFWCSYTVWSISTSIHIKKLFILSFLTNLCFKMSITYSISRMRKWCTIINSLLRTRHPSLSVCESK